MKAKAGLITGMHSASMYATASERDKVSAPQECTCAPPCQNHDLTMGQLSLAVARHLVKRSQTEHRKITLKVAASSSASTCSQPNVPP